MTAELMTQVSPNTLSTCHPVTRRMVTMHAAVRICAAGRIYFCSNVGFSVGRQLLSVSKTSCCTFFVHVPNKRLLLCSVVWCRACLETLLQSHASATCQSQLMALPVLCQPESQAVLGAYPAIKHM